MKIKLLPENASAEHSTDPGTVTRKMMRERAVELAVLGGRSALDASKTDWEQARRELSGD